jgi:transcriptional regulator with XRE-family HTH domain
MHPSLNQSGRVVNRDDLPSWGSDLNQHGRYCSPMPARIGPKRAFRLYIAEWRENRGLSQEELGARIGPGGVSDVTVSRWETGKRQPDLNAQAAIAEALDIDPRDLHRHPDQPSADALLRDQPQAIKDQAIAIIRAIRRG